MNGLIKRDNLEHVDLGFAFLPEVNRHGFAYESSLPIIDFAKDSLKLSKLIAITDEHNLASQGLLEKLEFTRVGVVTVKEEWGESLLYEKHLNT
jgi:RimJ/RimL family protein N-acetyltransferase